MGTSPRPVGQIACLGIVQVFASLGDEPLVLIRTAQGMARLPGEIAHLRCGLFVPTLVDASVEVKLGHLALPQSFLTEKTLMHRLFPTIRRANAPSPPQRLLTSLTGRKRGGRGQRQRQSPPAPRADR